MRQYKAINVEKGEREEKMLERMVTHSQRYVMYTVARYICTYV